LPKKPGSATSLGVHERGSPPNSDSASLRPRVSRPYKGNPAVFAAGFQRQAIEGEGLGGFARRCGVNVPTFSPVPAAAGAAALIKSRSRPGA
jgi:hypothetical protein